MKKDVERTGAGAVLLAAASLTGCGKSSELGWLTNLGGSILFGGFKWAFACGILGLLIAIISCRVLRGSGAAAATQTVKLLRLASFLLLLLVLPISFAYVGFFEGLLRASAHELSEGEFAQQYFPMIGSAGADLVGTVLLMGDPTIASSPSNPGEKVVVTVAFQSGEREIIASQIPALIAAIDGDFVRGISQDIKQRTQEKFPGLNTGKGKQVLDWFMDNCSDALVRVALQEQLESKGLGSVLDLFGEMIRQLPGAAVREGNPETLSHQELSAFIVEATIAGGIVKFVIKPFCRVNQIGAVVPVLLAFLIPIVVLRRSAGDDRPAEVNAA